MNTLRRDRVHPPGSQSRLAVWREVRWGMNCAVGETWEMDRVWPLGGAGGGGGVRFIQLSAVPVQAPVPPEGRVGALALQRWICGEGQNFLGYQFSFSLKICKIGNWMQVSLLEHFPEVTVCCVQVPLPNPQVGTPGQTCQPRPSRTKWQSQSTPAGACLHAPRPQSDPSWAFFRTQLAGRPSSALEVGSEGRARPRRVLSAAARCRPYAELFRKCKSPQNSY